MNAPLTNVSELEDILAGRGKSLRIGKKGEGVKAIQKALMQLKYLVNTTADGDFGPKTEAAAKAVQAAKNSRMMEWSVKKRWEISIKRLGLTRGSGIAAK